MNYLENTEIIYYVLVALLIIGWVIFARYLLNKKEEIEEIEYICEEPTPAEILKSMEADEERELERIKLAVQGHFGTKTAIKRSNKAALLSFFEEIGYAVDDSKTNDDLRKILIDYLG